MLKPGLMVLALTWAPSAALAQSFDAALTAALANNPNMEDARLGVRSAQYDRMQARAGYLPDIDVLATYGAQDIETRTAGPTGPIIQDSRLEPSTASLRLSQEIFTSGRRSGEMRAATAGLAGARHALRSTEQRILLSAAQAYLEVVAQQRIAELRAEQVAALEQELSATRRRLDVGEVSRTDVLQVRTRLAGARAGAARASAELAGSQARFEEVIGAPAGELAAPPPPPNAPIVLREALARAETSHPVVLEARTLVDAAHGRVAVERAALLPQISVVGSFDRYEDDDFSERRREGTSAAARFSMPLFEGGYAWARMGRERVNVRRAEARVEAARRQARSLVSAAWSDALAAREISETAREQVQASAEALAGAERERGLGLRSTIDVLNAQEEWRNAQIALARAEAEEVLAGYMLQAAMGALTLGSVEP